MSKPMPVVAVKVRFALTEPGTGDPPFSIGEPRVDAAAFLDSLVAAKKRVVLYDDYADTRVGLAQLVMWLEDAKIDNYAELWDKPGERPPADEYVEDR